MSEQMKEEVDNMMVYNSFRSVPAEATKKFNNGRFSGTDINPMWRIKRMTEMFGMCGAGWYVEVVSRELREAHDSNGTVAAFCALNLYVKVNGEWSKPIYGEGGNIFVTTTSKGFKQVDDDAFKKAYTDAFSNATKQLGLGADIWFENDKANGTKYVSPTTLTPAAVPEQVTPAAPLSIPTQPLKYSDILDWVNGSQTIQDLTILWNINAETIKRYTNLQEAFTRRKNEIQNHAQ